MNKFRRNVTTSNTNYLKKIQIVNMILSAEYANPNVCRCWPFIIDIIWPEGQRTHNSNVGKTVDGKFQQKPGFERVLVLARFFKNVKSSKHKSHY